MAYTALAQIDFLEEGALELRTIRYPDGKISYLVVWVTPDDRDVLQVEGTVDKG